MVQKNEDKTIYNHINTILILEGLFCIYTQFLYRIAATEYVNVNCYVKWIHGLQMSFCKSMSCHFFTILVFT